jgi:two-component system, NarL family, nitrate/nitrite response regulator NarL
MLRSTIIVLYRRKLTDGARACILATVNDGGKLSARRGTSLRQMATAPELGVGPEKPIRVLLVSDVCVYRESLVEALGREDGIEVAGSTSSDIAGLEIAVSKPAVVLVDASSELGLARVQALAAAMPSLRIVAVGIPDDEAVELEFLEAGVAGYVTAEQPLADLVEAVDAAANGELNCSPRLSAALAERVAAFKAVAPRGNGSRKLTRRQREIAALISEGLSNKQIAHRLSIEQATVKNHIHNIFAALGLSHRDEVAALIRTSLLG